VRIVFDHSVFSLQSRGGISRYFYELAARLQRRDDCSPLILAPLHISNLLRETADFQVTGRYMPMIAGTHLLRQIVNNVLSSLLIRRESPDIIHGTYYLSRINWPPTIPYVITVFDMIHERFADWMPAGEAGIAAAKLRSINRADQVICISEHTRQDVIELTGIPMEKTTVIHLGCSLDLHGPHATDPLLKEPYLLYIGERGRVKNFTGLLRAFAQTNQLSKELRLLCFGGGPFTSDELRQVIELGLAPERLVQMTGDDRVLVNLYQHAAALIYPSLYEGFGLPILEAMACDCPVLCSNTSSMPEVAGQAALLFNPLSVDELAACMEKIVYSASTRERLISAGRDRVARFSWQRCADETVEVYNRCL
jgi:glycosyltransferase involved in cell wall biosynthesis